MELQVLNLQGTPTGEKVTLDDALFNVEPNDHAIYLDVRRILASRRQGTHKVKERGEVSGSTKKPYKQKGTGNARAGHKRSPLWRHGGTIFGPRPRDYSFKLNRKVQRLARRSALAYKSRADKITVVEHLQLPTHKTGDFRDMLQKLNFGKAKLLFVTPDYHPNLYLSGKNMEKIWVVNANQLNTYDVMNAERVVIAKESIPLLKTVLS